MEDNNNEPVTSLKMDQESRGILNARPSMLGNRRKQSKPNRIHGQTSAEISKSEPEARSRTPFDCDQCPSSHDSYEDLAWHQYQAHGLIKLDKNQPDSLENCSGNDDMDSELHNLSPEAKNEKEPGEVTNKTGIYHADTHCQVCDRDFCNKYFLQTHLASKHGIFKDVSRSPSNLPKDNPMDLTANYLDSSVVKSVTGASVSSPVVAAQANFNPGLSLSSLSGQNYYPKLSENYTKLPASVRPLTECYPKLPDYPKLPENYTKLSENYKFLPTQPEPEKLKRGIEDFCELCQKHFCNKYYLRKHKMDVHGIHSDPYSVRRRLGLNSSERREQPVYTSASMIPQPSPAPMLMMTPFAPMMALPPDPMLFQRYSMPGMMGMNLSKDENAEKRQEDKDKQDPRPASKEEDRQKAMEEARPFSHTHFIDELMSKYDKNVDRRERHHGSSDGCRSEENSPSKLSPKSEPMDEDTRNEAETERAPDHPRTCEVCLKVFADKYSLRMHKLNIHDIHPKIKEKQAKPEIPAPFVPSTQPDLSLRFPVPIPSSFTPFSTTMTMASTPGDFDVLASMYGSMTAAKLADRVTCDICNKDVCNKYFLKTHKVKMHAIDPATLLDSPQKEDSPELPESTAPASVASSFPGINGNIIPGIPTSPGYMFGGQDPCETENSRREELLKLGIDPESYCEICRKEFCSKYFLRTHKLNMHGIPTDKPGNRKEDREISRREIMQREMMMQQNFGQLPMDYSAVNNPEKTGSLSSFLPQSPFKPTVKKEFDLESLDSNKSDKSSKAKDPANSIRVKCELCNKELCNKYFLRTHKMKKHGIVDDVLSEGQQRKLLELQRQGMFPVISYNGYKSEKEEKDGKTGSESPAIANGGDFSTLCQICHESFPTLDLLHIHMFMTHGKMNKDSSVCQMCGLLCKDQIGLQLHMVQEHNATINITPEGEKSPEAPKTPESSKSPETGMNMASSTPVFARHADLYMDGFLTRRHLNFMDTSLKSDTSYQSSPSSESTKKRLYSCTKCPFKTRVVNHLHAHQKLKHRKDSSVGISSRKFTCRNCRKRFLNRKTFRSHYLVCKIRNCPNCKFSSDLRNLKLHMIMNHPHSPNAIENVHGFENGSLNEGDDKFVMQKFSIADKADSNFANAFVYLPVAQKIERPITVSLHLTPTDR